MNSFFVQVTSRGKLLLQDFCDSLNDALFAAQDVAEVGAVVEIWSGFIAADTNFDPDELLYSYVFDKEDVKDV